MRSFKKQTESWVQVDEIKYASYKIYFLDGLRDSLCISHVMGKLDYLGSLGNYGSYKQFMEIFIELCEYLDNRAINYQMVFPGVGVIIFSLICCPSRRLPNTILKKLS